MEITIIVLIALAACICVLCLFSVCNIAAIYDQREENMDKLLSKRSKETDV